MGKTTIQNPNKNWQLVGYVSSNHTSEVVTLSKNITEYEEICIVHDGQNDVPRASNLYPISVLSLMTSGNSAQSNTYIGSREYVSFTIDGKTITINLSQGSGYVDRAYVYIR